MQHFGEPSSIYTLIRGIVLFLSAAAIGMAAAAAFGAAGSTGSTGPGNLWQPSHYEQLPPEAGIEADTPSVKAAGQTVAPAAHADPHQHREMTTSGAGAAEAASAPAPAAPAAPAVDAAPGGRWVQMEVTAYCPCARCCGQWADGITASGRPVTHNNGLFVAADRKHPFGTRMIIPGYADGRPVEVLDRGGAIRGDKLDLFFPTHQEALNWGRQHLSVFILD